MFKIIVVVIKCIPILIYLFFYELFHMNPKKVSRVKTCNILSDNLEKILKRCGIELVVTGRENIPNEQSYLICPNHQSMLDAFVIFSLYKNQPLSFIAKKSVKNIPLLSGIFKRTNGYFMDRSDLRSELKIMKNVRKSLVEDDVKWVIFPEGTRTKDTINYSLNPFKAGALKFPMQVKKSILPVALYGTHKVLDLKEKRRKYKVYVHIFEPLTSDFYMHKTTQEVSDYMQSMIEEKVQYFHKQYSLEK